MQFQNPIIPGFHPDPSICRVGEDFFLVTSSFEYFPGVPLFHSRDLVHWRQIGHCLTRKSQLTLSDAWSSGGIFAPTLRYHNGRFYMVTTNVSNYGHFYVYTDDPYGEWSEPVRVQGSGFDPDLFFDEDEHGNCHVYFTHHADDFEGIRLCEIDIRTGKLIGPEYRIWPGFEDDLCEAPHIYKINGWYYLLVAEGGTFYGHMAVIARSERVTGPYESCPYNPILSHRPKVAEPIQATGHADLVQAQDNSWWMVFLGIRPLGWHHHHLGRETFLAPVHWTTDGWPIITRRKTAVQLEIDAPSLPQQPWPPEPVRDEFNTPRLALPWNFRKSDNPALWSLSDRPGWLAMYGPAETLDSFSSPAFIGRRQQHFTCTVTTRMEFTPASDGEEAGMTAFMDENHHYEIAIRRKGEENQMIVRKRIGDLSAVVAAEPALAGCLYLRIAAKKEKYQFSCSSDGQSYHPLAEGLTRYLSSEVAGGFTGVYFALFASGSGKPSTRPAYFDWFDYLPGD